MKVLVTGGAGYIGSHAARALAAAGHAVVVCDDLSAGERRAAAGHELVVADIGDAAAMTELFARGRFDAVMHFAAFIDSPESVRAPLKYFRNNTCGTVCLLEQCAAHGVRVFVLSSTAAVYGVAGAEPVDEKRPVAPISPYGWSKLMAERALVDAARAGDMRTLSLRYYNVAGADPEGRLGQCGAPRHLIKKALRAVLDAKHKAEAELEVFGDDYATPDGSCVRDYIHVSDLADAHVRTLAYLSADGVAPVELMNCGYGRGYSVFEVVAAVERVTGAKFALRRAARRAGDPPCLIANSARLQSALDWTPRYADLDVIVKTAWDWERRLGPGGSWPA